MLEVITVVKDDLPGLMETYKSLSAQSNRDFSWLIIDGSSKSISAENFFEDKPFELRVVNQPPKGIYDAMNAGMMQSKQDWIWFINAGDVLFDSQTIAKVVKVISDNPGYGAFGFCVRHLDSHGNLWHTSHPRLRYLVEKDYTFAEINHQGFIVSANAMKSIGGFDTSLRYAADSKFMDLVVNTQLTLLSDICVANFMIGGASSQNISKTLDEIDLHRSKSETVRNLSHRRVLFILKTKIRLIIIKRQGLLFRVFFYLRKFVS
jgi:glycosyltransferase involved in cell wall biosynthesis